MISSSDSSDKLAFQTTDGKRDKILTIVLDSFDRQGLISSNLQRNSKNSDRL